MAYQPESKNLAISRTSASNTNVLMSGSSSSPDKGRNSQSNDLIDASYPKTSAYATSLKACIEKQFSDKRFVVPPTGSSAGGSDSSSGGAEEDENDRLRRLFSMCDRDGDGFINEHDLYEMCQLLGMEDSFHEITQQLGVGATPGGSKSISFDDFIQCRTRLAAEFDGDECTGGVQFSGATERHRMIDSMTGDAVRQITADSSDTSLGLAPGDSLDYDSGARDVESVGYSAGVMEQPVSLFTLLERHDPELLQTYLDVTSSLQQSGNTTNILMEANKLHMSAMTALKSELADISGRLQRARTEIHLMDKQISRLQSEKLVIQRDAGVRAEQQVVRYEDRMTELHGVIAELRKKLDQRNINIIREEEEVEESDGVQSNKSNDEPSVNENSNVEDLNADFSRVVADLETALGSHGKFATVPRAHSSSDKPASNGAQLGIQGHSAVSQRIGDASHKNLNNPEAKPESFVACDEFQTIDIPPRTDISADRWEMKLELLEQDNENLLEQTSLQEAELIRLRNELIGAHQETDKCKKMIEELQQRARLPDTTNTSVPTFFPASASTSSPCNSQLSTPSKLASAVTGRSLMHQALQHPVAKVAELKKLKTGKQDRPVLGSQITSLGLTSGKMAEHLAHGMHESSSLQEMLQMVQLDGAAAACNNSGATPCGSSGAISLSTLNKIRELEIDLERLQCKADNLKSQNDVLSLTLQESKFHSDRVTVLIGRYESNNTALQMSVTYSDQALEIYHVLTSLLDTELALMLARFRASGFAACSANDPQDSSQLLQKAHLARKGAEHIARQLLARLDRSDSNHTSRQTQQNSSLSCPPWDELSSTSRTASTTSSTGSGADDTEFGKQEERRLRDHLHALMSDRSVVKLTVMELESIHLDPFSTAGDWCGKDGEKDGEIHPDALRLDLENAILMQELMALKEEKAELKAENYLLEKERSALELELNGRESQTRTYLTQIEYLKTELSQTQFNSQPISTTSDFAQRKDRVGTNMRSPASEFPCRSGTPPVSNAEVAELMRRENALKQRVQELMTSLDTLTKNSELRHQQSAMFVNELKRANSALVSAFEKMKKKYTSKTKKMEEQMAALIDRHETQMQVLSHKNATLESELARYHCNRVS